MDAFAEAREAMVTRQIAARGIDDPSVLAALRTVPRELFVTPGDEQSAYQDRALPIEAGQTISQPYIVALMIAAADISADDRVLEVGAGSGYAAAVIGQLARDVIAIERHPALAELAAARMAELGYARVRIVSGDGTLGWPEAGPFDAILVAAAGEDSPAGADRPVEARGTAGDPAGRAMGGADPRQADEAARRQPDPRAAVRGAVRPAGGGAGGLVRSGPAHAPVNPIRSRLNTIKPEI